VATSEPGEDIAPQEEPAVSQVHISLNLAEGARVRVTVESLTNSSDKPNPAARVVIESQGDSEQHLVILPSSLSLGDVSESGTRPVGVWLAARWHALAKGWRALAKRRAYSFEASLFGVTLILYLATRLTGLSSFPIYFFGDEAIQTVAASDLIHNHLLDEERTLLPTYFKNGSFYNLSVSVYLQVLPYLVFGKSVFVTRATSVLFSALAVVAVGLILRDIYKLPYWWAGAALLSIAPAWFLHSRTAFETVLFVAFYAAFLYTYLLYRYRSANYLTYAILSAALAFYSYNPGQLVVVASGILLLLSDARYHWQNRKEVVYGLGLVAILSIPYLRFRLSHPEAALDQLRKLGSYWVQPLPLNEKWAHYWSEYFYGLSPAYWFLPNDRDLPRHLMKGYGNLLRATSPFAAFGFFLAVKELRSPANRAILIALFVAPASSALVQIGITRSLSFIIPATILTTLGISKVFSWLEGKHWPRLALSLGLFAVLTTVNLAMLRDALVNGPTWYQDYGLGGMQYGARQVFAEVKDYVARSPATKILLSPDWANGAHVLARFFLPDPLPIELGSIDGHIFQRLPLDDDTLFVMTPEDYQTALESGKFTDIRVEQTLPYPNGEPGFFFARLRYVENIDTILKAEREQRRVLQSGVVTIDGQPVQVRYPLLDMGEVSHMFDSNRDTLGRTLEANPTVIELTFPKPRTIRGVAIIIGSAEVEIRALAYPTPDSPPIKTIQILKGTVDQPQVSLDFDKAILAQKLRLEIRDLHQTEPAHIHIWEIYLR
jgi:4-amino-4-deoxy-L-arabinose transferase-like glycosyltransferase